MNALLSGSFGGNRKENRLKERFHRSHSKYINRKSKINNFKASFVSIQRLILVCTRIDSDRMIKKKRRNEIVLFKRISSMLKI